MTRAIASRRLASPFTKAERLVGEAAVNQAALNPTNPIFGEKELLHTSCFYARLYRLVIFFYPH
jgi:hypothetical protein